MLGGGIFVTQNKTLPGSYVNFVNASSVTSTIGDRGVVAIALRLGKDEGAVFEITSGEFATNCEALLGAKYDSDTVAALREIFRHATKAVIYDLGTDGQVSEAISALEAYEFNVLCAYTSDATETTDYITAVKTWRNELGKKCQVVVYNAEKPDHEGVINVVSTVSDAGADTFALVAWVAGAEAGCKINESCTNMLYDGEYTVITNKTQAQLEQCIKSGQIALHLVYGQVRLLEDVNSLTTTTAEKGEDFKYNQTIRVVDQMANDSAKLFNTKYLGKIANNEAGRGSLWCDLEKYCKELEAIGAIENFDSSLLRVAQGDTKKSVVINNVVNITNAMAQLYMTVVIQ